MGTIFLLFLEGGGGAVEGARATTLLYIRWQLGCSLCVSLLPSTLSTLFCVNYQLRHFYFFFSSVNPRFLSDALTRTGTAANLSLHLLLSYTLQPFLHPLNYFRFVTNRDLFRTLHTEKGITTHGEKYKDIKGMEQRETRGWAKAGQELSRKG